MNTLVAARFQELSDPAKVSLKRAFASSPKMLRYVELLEKRKGKKHSVQEAVDFIYGKEEDDFETLRNRFFKLRKKLLEQLNQGIDETSGVRLMPLEETLYRCRELVYQNHFHAAKSSLEKLIKECWEKNIFELLPDAINLSVFCNLALNVFAENERLFGSLAKANQLLFDLNSQRQLSRQFYQGIVEHKDQEYLKNLTRAFKKIGDRNKDFPRFRLYYNFSLLTHGIGSLLHDEKVINRMFRALKKEIAKNPDVPLAFYEPHSAEIIQYYLLNAEGMFTFQNGDLLQSYSNMKDAWELMDKVPALRIKKTESSFSNKISIEVATKRYKEALSTANELLDFLKEHKQEEKRLKAYSEIIQVHTYAFPAVPPADPQFLNKKLDVYIASIDPANRFLFFGTLLLKGVFLFQQKQFAKAYESISVKGMSEFLTQVGMPEYMEVFEQGRKPDKTVILKLVHDLNTRLKDETRSMLVFPLQRALTMLQSLNPG